MNSKIDDFIGLFASEWHNAKKEDRVPCSNPYEDRDPWKSFIEGEDGLIHRIMKRVETKAAPLEFQKESLFRFDAAYLQEGAFYAIFEHELNNDPEKEIQKLVLARARLKVLIFYDWGEDEKTTEWRTKWINSKLSYFSRIRSLTQAISAEPDDTAYIFLIGCRTNATSYVSWDWASSDLLERRPIPQGREG